MLRIGTPPDVENYIAVVDEVASQLHLLGFYPRWRDGEFVYFLYAEELANFIGGDKDDK